MQCPWSKIFNVNDYKSLWSWYQQLQIQPIWQQVIKGFRHFDRSFFLPIKRLIFCMHMSLNEIIGPLLSYSALLRTCIVTYYLTKNLSIFVFTMFSRLRAIKTKRCDDINIFIGPHLPSAAVAYIWLPLKLKFNLSVRRLHVISW